ncbi:MAG: hypothetical protein EAZ78_07445 [Oscillatoriales cyanobacterium]|nr:MAG: hypothetical protein EAZ78_07445 [Oscillatoriales cyanobacterium]TAF66214.1 MAG: hypothetical protein EAZ59_14770 [Oscillatoriales cyanobacterium]
MSCGLLLIVYCLLVGANTLCPMPYALCPMPYALCPMPYALCPIPNYQFIGYLALDSVRA